MLDRIGLNKRDKRNLLTTMGIMTFVLFFYVEGSFGTRVAAAVIGGFATALVFVVVTVGINAYKARYWY